ncbi:hypothetical protein VIGAN_04117200 [Vigna angularis var. angularis]|uniref:Ubiquitin-like protease family profile domain-containing protein n=1 Tax=Vigna angularis var. angularis TaxID=157739 RepID=A0A0S3RTM8_PHAAN|nr:hypothetical protein VIGAN_04117200 [Vigna angularis var. angularis]
MTHERNKFDEIQAYITTCFAMGKDIYFLPSILGSLVAHMMLFGRSTTTAKKLAWVNLKCNRQIRSYECGYYIMYWMMTIIRSHYTSGWETRFNMTTPILEKSLKLVRKALAKYLIQLYNSM